MSSLFTQPRRREILRTSHSRKFAEKVRKIVHLGDAQPTLGRVGRLCPCLKLEKVPMQTIVDRSTLEVLGHATVAITPDIYSHVIPGIGDQKARAMEDALS